MVGVPHDYLERVYAGVLGKMIGVYLGRPFEGWTYERIMAELGEIDGYVNERLPGKPPLVVTDDDLAGTFVFLRALPDHRNDIHLTPAQIGETWLNYLIEGRTILWWGGLGNSTEHSAYLRLKQGVPAPQSGSIALNGKIVAEQIGAQIFIDGWAMICPGDPERAADFARRAASVSHDGEALYAAQALAAMQAQAFVEQDIDRLLDTAVAPIPHDSTIYRLVQDLRDWHAGEPDWHATRARITAQYGYDRYGGVCHVVPNHALILLGLLYGAGDFQHSMRVVNTAGWDTDCNAGNLGCLLGIRNGLAGFASNPDWRSPIADRLFLVSADGGSVISDGLHVAYWVANIGKALAGEPPLEPKGGARFHFEGEGSVQGFRAHPWHGGRPQIANTTGHSRCGTRSLELRYQGGGALLTPTFILPEEREISWYPFLASPCVYPGQTLRAGLTAGNALKARLLIQAYNARDELDTFCGPEVCMRPDEYTELDWRLPDLHGQPITAVGVAVEGESDTEGTAYLDYLTWEGEPQVHLMRPPGGGQPWEPPQMWRRAWVDGVDQWNAHFPQAYNLAQNQGRGLLIQGARDWRDYSVSAEITPTLLSAGGVAVRVQGMRRYYALLMCSGGRMRLVKVCEGEQILVERDYPWIEGQPCALRLQAQGERLQAWVNGEQFFDVVDRQDPLTGGAAALVCEEGHLSCDALLVEGLA